jgi:hypothetical protein
MYATPSSVSCVVVVSSGVDGGVASRVGAMVVIDGNQLMRLCYAIGPVEGGGKDQCQFKLNPLRALYTLHTQQCNDSQAIKQIANPVELKGMSNQGEIW